MSKLVCAAAILVTLITISRSHGLPTLPGTFMNGDK
jgi:hypothetical protein